MMWLMHRFTFAFVCLTTLTTIVHSSPTPSAQFSAPAYPPVVSVDESDPADANKYFHEPARDDLARHYDIRYFSGIVTDDVRKSTLKHLIRAYLSTFQELGLETWIAHGTLLGWYWSGSILPWDWDLDVQVTGSTLSVLAKSYNYTFYDYNDVHDGSTGRYLLDINPWQWERVRGDGANIIDGRFVDIQSGLFVDITGISETHPDTDPGIWQCKNEHKYQIQDIFPLRETTFEGIPARIPYSYGAILTEEYSGFSLTRVEFQGHRFDTEIKEWLELPKTQQPPQKSS